MIATLIAPDRETNKPHVCVIIGPADMFATTEGNPMPGVALNVANAREIAYRMLYLCQLIENGKSEPIQTS